MNIRAADNHIAGYLCKSATDPDDVAVAVATGGLAATDEDEAAAITLV